MRKVEGLVDLSTV